MDPRKNLIPLTSESRKAMGSTRKRPNIRAVTAIASMQVVLLKVFRGMVEEEGSEGPILRNAKPSELAACATAWDRLEERRAILAGHGKPKPVQATNDPSAAKPNKTQATEDEPGTVRMPLPTDSPAGEQKVG